MVSQRGAARRHNFNRIARNGCQLGRRTSTESTSNLTENEKFTIKKSSKKEPAAMNNLNIKAAGLSFWTADILFADGYFFIYPVSNRVPHTIVNGSRINTSNSLLKFFPNSDHMRRNSRQPLPDRFRCQK